MANERWNLETNSDLTSEPGSPVGLLNDPLTAAQRLTARPSNYGARPEPPKPFWYKDIAGTAHGGGKVMTRVIQLFWHSGVGAIAAHAKMPPIPALPDADMTALGSKGIDSAGIEGHYLYVGTPGDTPSLILPGAKVSATITGYRDEDGDWVPIAPDTEYDFTIKAYNSYRDKDGALVIQTGPASDTLTITTPERDTTDVGNLPLPPPQDVALNAPLPIINSASTKNISLRWNKVPYATSYEVYDNSTPGTEVMDDTRPGLNIGDTLLATVSQPGGQGPVTGDVGAYAVPGQPFALKVRTVRTMGDPETTSRSIFSPLILGQIPPAQAVPGVPGAPTLTVSPVVGGRAKLTIVPPTIDSTHGAPSWYAVYDGTLKLGTVTPPLGDPPHFEVLYPAAKAYNFKVVAGNSWGASAPSTALTGTIPAAAAPVAPTGLALNGAVATTSVPVKWDPVVMEPPVTAYKVYQGGSTLKATVAGSSTNAIAAGYSAGDTYTLTVKATNGVGEGSASSSITGKTAAVPTAPTSVGVSSVTATGFTVGWTAPANPIPAISAYKIYDGGVLKSTVPAPATSAPLTGYTAGTAYSLVVKATNGIGEGAGNSAVTGATTPPAPTGLVLDTPAPTTTTVNFKWNAVANAAKYEFYQGSTKKGEVTAPTVAATIDDYTASSAYSITVAAVTTGGGLGPKSTPLTGTTPAS